MPVSALSAIGSAILPKSVTRSRRAGDVAVDLVGDHREREDQRTPRSATARPAPSSTSSSQPKNGTSTIRSVVSALAGSRSDRRRGRCGRVGGRRRSAVTARPPGRDQASATRSTPSRRRRRRPRTRSPTASARARRRAWSCRRPRGPGARRGPRRVAVVDAYSTQHLDHLADPLLGPLGGQLLDQAGDVLDALARSRPRRACRRSAAASVPSSSE